MDHHVYSSGHVLESADRVWALVRDFHGSWHPAIATIAREYDNIGRQIRVFTVHNDDKTYREKLTWFSNSERSLAYTHVEGIDDVDWYYASLSVVSNLNGATSITLSADLSAAEPRATEIAAGTQTIFDSAIEAIKNLAGQRNEGAEEDVAISHQFAPIRSRTVDNKLAVSYVNGPKTKSNTLCLFVHGIGGNRHNWQNQLLAVSPYCTAAAHDIRGYGDSAPRHHQSTVDDHCNDILSVADAFGAEKLVLCGLSYGAWIATSFAMRYANRLSSLVLAGGCTGMSEENADEREAFRQKREAPLLEGKTPADFAADVVDILAGPAIDESVKDELLISMSAIPAHTYADAVHCFTNPTELFDFSKICIPVLLMTGDADKLATPNEIKNVAKRIFESSSKPDVRFECLPQTGHVCNLESPHAFNAPLLQLVQRVVKYAR